MEGAPFNLVSSESKRAFSSEDAHKKVAYSRKAKSYPTAYVGNEIAEISPYGENSAQPFIGDHY
ncbi:hypothetical protein KJA15_02235 [Patescibacteria group bacterium]|nr:hypothetical protein [Patescibacteria group bacterium]